MNLFTTIADTILNGMIIAAAAYLIYLAVRHLWSGREPAPLAGGEAVDPAYWDLLAETRRILDSEH
jgi:threonine/homoserine/homoserine lactone efflux protein